MYKVFFNDRTLFLTDDFSKNFQSRYGLFYKYREKEDLEEIIDIYQQISKIKSLIVFHYDIEELRQIFKSCFTNIDAAGGIVRNSKDQYLFIYRRGKWDLPKGKLDSGETYQQAALREVSEECGIDGLIPVRPLLSTYHTYLLKKKLILKKTYWFEMRVQGSPKLIPQLEEDITEAKWISENELPNILTETYPLVVDIFKYLGYL